MSTQDRKYSQRRIKKAKAARTSHRMKVKQLLREGRYSEITQLRISRASALHITIREK